MSSDDRKKEFSDLAQRAEKGLTSGKLVGGPTPTPTLVERAQGVVDAAMDECDRVPQPVEDDTYHLDSTHTGKKILVAHIAGHIRSERARFARELVKNAERNGIIGWHLNWLRAAAEREERGE